MHVHIQNRLIETFMPLTAEVVQNVAAQSSHRFSIANDDDGFATAAQTMDVLVTTADQVLARFPFPAPRLRAVFLKHAGVDGLVGRNPLPPNVVVLNNSGAHARKAGEYVVMASLMLQAGMPSFMNQQRQRIWQPQFSPSLAGRRVTILGVGGIGAAAARALRPFGVFLTGLRSNSDHHADFDQTCSTDAIDRILPETDILVLAAPLTRATRDIVDASRLRLLPRHAGIINVARGELIDEAALIAALESGALAGAVIDVTRSEPLSPSDPLWHTPNLVITPHISSTDSETYAIDTMRILLRNLEDLEAGRRPANLVDLARGY